MIIKKVTVAYMVGDKPCATFEEAQKEELFGFLEAYSDPALNAEKLSGLAGHILAGKAKVVDILTSTPRSRAKARKVNGATKKRKTTAAVVVTPAQ